MADIQAVIETARSWLGAPWVHTGRDPRLGLDCQGLVTEAFRRNGWRPNNPREVFDTSYGQRPCIENVKRLLAGECDEVGFAQAQPGDVILFKPYHLALVSDVSEERVQFIHANRWLGHVTETHLDGKWDTRIIQVYRLKGRSS